MFRKFRNLGLAIACISMTACTAMCGTRVEPGSVGILVDNLSGGDTATSMKIINGPDMVFVGPYHTLYEFPTSIQQYTWTVSAHEGAAHDESFQFQTKDGSVVHADLGITYHVGKDQVLNVFRKYRKSLPEIQDVFIRNIVREALNEVTSGLDVGESIGPQKQFIISEVQKRVTTRLGADGITVDSLSMVGAFRPPQVVIDSLNAKLAATQNALRVQNEVMQTQAEALKAKAQAEGEAASAIARAKGAAESRRIEAETEANANERIAKSLTAELVKYKQIEKWNGAQPSIVAGAGTGFILNMNDTPGTTALKAGKN